MVPFGLNYQLTATHTGYDTAISFVNIGPEHVAKGAKVDLWLGQEAQTGCVSGTVRHIRTRQPVPGAVLTFADTVTGEQQTFRADARGQYQACLPPGTWRVHSGAAGYFFARTRLDIPAGQITLIHDVDLTPLEKDAVMVLRNIYFDVDKATLREESVAELDRLLEVMRQNPSLVVEIAGHTDSDASETHNQTLSQHRAEAVVDYLLAAGIERARMVAAGYGESRPVAPNDSPANKQLNRRTECKVLAF
jgi:outer membrane protein OmpA-like peptidoglycan-associated protein